MTDSVDATFEIVLSCRVPVIPDKDSPAYDDSEDLVWLKPGGRYIATKEESLLRRHCSHFGNSGEAVILLKEQISNVYEVLVFGCEYEPVDVLTLLAEVAE